MLEYFSKNNTLTLGTADVESTVPFNSRHIQKGCTAVMSGDSAEINKCGVYDVRCDVCFSASTTADVTMVLYVDNVRQPQTERTVSVSTVDDFYTMNFETYVQKNDNNCGCNVCTSPTDLRVAISASVADVVLTFETTDIQIYRAAG